MQIEVVLLLLSLLLLLLLLVVVVVAAAAVVMVLVLQCSGVVMVGWGGLGVESFNICPHVRD